MSAWTVITGASAGIGRELAEIFAGHGRDLVLIARNQDRLAELADTLRSSHGVRVELLVQDLSAPRAAETTQAACAERGLEVDTLVNNAGFGHLGAFHEANPKNELAMIELNITTLTHLTRLMLPEMVARRNGKILNVASTAAFQPGPYMAVYYATKAYVLSFSEAIAEELAGTGVTVTALCPGPTKTEFQARADMDASRLTRMGLQSARSVAEVGYRAMMKGKAVAVPGLMNQMLALSVRASPRFAVRKITGWLNRSN